MVSIAHLLLALGVSVVAELLAHYIIKWLESK